MSHPLFVTEPSLVHIIVEVTSVPSGGALVPVPEYGMPLIVSLSKVRSVLKATTLMGIGLLLSSIEHDSELP